MCCFYNNSSTSLGQVPAFPLVRSCHTVNADCHWGLPIGGKQTKDIADTKQIQTWISRLMFLKIANTPCRNFSFLNVSTNLLVFFVLSKNTFSSHYLFSSNQYQLFPEAQASKSCLLISILKAELH